MELDIRAEKRVLYKTGNSGWLVGTVCYTENAEVDERGVWIPIVPLNATGEPDFVEIHNLYTDGVELEDWMKDNLLSKEEYIKIIEDDNFEKNLEAAWVSDGEYYYYPITKFNANWIMKQPFQYIIRNC